MNIELAERVLAHIKAHREAFDMKDGLDINCATRDRIGHYPCGTVACIAGWTVLLADFKNSRTRAIADYICSYNWLDLKNRATQLLGITNLEAQELFYFKSMAQTNRDAIARFESFIESKKKESANLFDDFSP